MTDMGIGDPIRDDLKVRLPSARAWNTLTFPSADTERACMHQSFFTRPPSTTTSIRPDTHPTKASAQVKNCSAQPQYSGSCLSPVSRAFQSALDPRMLTGSSTSSAKDRKSCVEGKRVSERVEL